MVEEFLLSPHWTRVALISSVLLVPSVLIFAWFRGKAGRDRMAKAEKLGVPANVAFCVALLWAVFAETDLGAATTAVTVETEDGEVIQRAVAIRFDGLPDGAFGGIMTSALVPLHPPTRAIP